MMRSILILFSTAFLFLPNTHFAQQVTEAEIYLQRIFIEGNREMALGNYESAIQLFQEVLKEDPGNDAAWFKIARLEMLTDHPERAIRNIEKAIGLKPKNPWYLLFKGEVQESIGRSDRAADTYGKLVALQPDDSEFYHRQARALLKDGRPGDAIKVYEKLEKRTGVTEDLARKKHTLYLGLGNTNKATLELERLVEAYPFRLQYRYLLAEFYEQTGSDKDARKVYEAILAMEPEESRAKLRLAGEPEPNDDRIRFVNSLEPIFREEKLGIDPKIKRIIPLIEEVAAKQEVALADALLSLMDVLKEVHPGEAKSFAASGDLLLYTDRAEDALREYTAALELDDTVFSVWENVLGIYATSYQFEDLGNTAEEAMDVFPNQAKLYLWSAIADIRLGKSGRAASTLKQAKLMSSGNPNLLLEVYYWDGVNQSQQQNWAAAEEAFQQALAMQPNSATVLSAYSLCLTESGERLKEALRYAEDALKLQPGLPQALQAKAWYFYKRANFQEASEWMNQANEALNEKNPLVLEQLGDIYFQLGETEQAIEWWEKARSLGSTSDLLEKKIVDRKLYE